jgi:hypothetical protein
MSFRWLAIALVGMLVLVAAPARADEVASAVGSARGSSLPIDPVVDAFAQAAADRQAAAGAISHSDLNGLLGHCDAVGEVVGRGPNVGVIFDLFRTSPSHWDTIRSGKWTAMGTGVAYDGAGLLYLSIAFCRVPGGTPPPAPKPQPAPAPQPEPPVVAPTFLLTVVDNLAGPDISGVLGMSPAIPMEEWQEYPFPVIV